MPLRAFAWKLATVPGDNRAPRCVYSIVLDVEDLEEGQAGVAGRIGSAQIEWLENLLPRIDFDACQK